MGRAESAWNRFRVGEYSSTVQLPKLLYRVLFVYENEIIRFIISSIILNTVRDHGCVTTIHRV